MFKEVKEKLDTMWELVNLKKNQIQFLKVKKYAHWS